MAGRRLHILGTLRSVTSIVNACACVALLVIVGCSPSLATPTAAPAAAPTNSAQQKPTAPPTTTSKPAAVAPVSGEIVVFAASSLTDVFQDMATAFEQANPNAKLTFNFGASTQLATQLGQGARADVFASADQAQMDHAKQTAAIASQDRVSARNPLVLITT